MNSKTPKKIDKVADQLASEMLDRIENGEKVPWKKPWLNSDSPGNFLNKSMNGYQNKGYKPYSGINAMICEFYTQTRGYEFPYFMTFHGFKEMCRIYQLTMPQLKGRGILIRTFNPKFKREDDESNIGVRGYFSSKPVFSICNFSSEDLDKLKESFECLRGFQHSTELSEIEDVLMKYIKSAGISLKHGSKKAAYYPSADEIVMPNKSFFPNINDYYATLAHEVAHSTAHKSRLNRSFGGSMNDHAYSKEELVAEYTAWRFMKGFNIDMPCSADYIQGWAKSIKDDRSIIMDAFKQANDAYKLITGEEEKCQS